MLKNFWMVTNAPVGDLDNLKSFRGNFFTLFSTSEILSFTTKNNKYNILLDGYILPALHANKLAQYANEDLAIKAYQQYGDHFTDHIKGSFILIIFNNNCCDIYTDQLGLRKAFIYNQDKSFYFSNSFWQIKKRVETSVSKRNVGINALINHYSEGTTLFEQISYSVRSNKYSINNIGYTNKSYFNIERFFDEKKQKITSKEFASSFQKIVDQYIDLLKLESPAITLTGGFDSRIILAAFLSRGIKPIVFNYGNAKSKDVKIAYEISRKFDLQYYNNQVRNPTAKWFNEMANIIVEKGQAITQIHRAHRLDTIIKLTSKYSVDSVFGGYMGGEGILGIYYDDLITSEFIRRLWANDENPESLINVILNKKFIQLGNKEKTEIKKFINDLPFYTDDHKRNHFLFSYMLKAETHHIQDVNLFNHYVPYNIPIYLDLDYIKILFSSKFNFLFKTNTRNPIKRIGYFQFYSEMIHHLFPDLGKIPLAKKGLYTPDEYLANKYVFAGKRLLRYLFDEHKYEPNFSLGNWVSDFVKNSLIKLESSELADLIDLDSYKQELLHSKSKRVKEKDWQRFTDLVMAEKILNFKTDQ